ncbi:hypothetical protein [Bacillus sp. FJAT-22090]|uniref:hypothetical protein n=1 Tax=Bacillus sp. FJAT-22090 TaxID=1581038 RepID=UPI0011A5437B|nr:hypothetical protein [Bacillus sp. FJAT-22090]
MEVKKWDEKEQFLFPASFGVPKEIKTVAVNPQFELSETEDSVHLVGIYHITCHVEFEEGEHAHHATSEFTQIEDLDVQGEVGYFEYAVPMSVEIGKNKIKSGSSPTLNVQHIDARTTEHASIEIAWSVHCEFEAPVAANVEKEVEIALDIEIETKREIEPVFENETTQEPNKEESTNNQSELQFILDLDDGYSKLTFPSNYVSVKQKADEQ